MVVQGMNYREISVENPPPRFEENARTYRKTSLTKAMRLDGPFIVNTSEGPLTCEDGYVARDARGYFYPIAKDEFEQIYEEVKEEA